MKQNGYKPQQHDYISLNLSSIEIAYVLLLLRLRLFEENVCIEERQTCNWSMVRYILHIR